MMKALLNGLDSLFDKDDLGKLILRVSFGVMFLLHGIHKLYGGTEFIQGLLVNHGLPAFVAYGVYVGEVIVPILIILGVLTRVSSIIWIGTCVMVIWLMHADNLFTVNKVGAWAAEGIGVYLFAAIAILLLGPGKYALESRSN
ncbi:MULTISPECIES: DoxX family protein [Vibrio]|uniref:DoxX family protein n=1 Tax=Vibrio TaxID=662 RepID=UPI001E3F805D|nr:MULTISPECIES: DoxX family protein [Vibrio]MCG6218836.1 DoxX family protein [Vibrio furnissii]UHJ59173.1 DoxX family protein [Vibrio furnissii]